LIAASPVRVFDLTTFETETVLPDLVDPTARDFDTVAAADPTDEAATLAWVSDPVGEALKATPDEVAATADEEAATDPAAVEPTAADPEAEEPAAARDPVPETVPTARDPVPETVPTARDPVPETVPTARDPVPETVAATRDSVPEPDIDPEMEIVLEID